MHGHISGVLRQFGVAFQAAAFFCFGCAAVWRRRTGRWKGTPSFVIFMTCVTVVVAVDIIVMIQR